MNHAPPPWPHLLRGALIAYDPDAKKPTPTVISFQYNPEELSRSFTPRVDKAELGPGGTAVEAHKAKEQSPKVSGPPIERIDLRIDIDATDQLAMRSPKAQSLGIHPTLAALELLMMPSLKQEENKQQQSKQGSAAVGPNRLPLVLFVWGTRRVQPVRVTSLSISETAFDQRLNPIHAEVQLSLQVLTTDELADSSIGKQVATASQSRRENLAMFITWKSASDYPEVPR